MARKTKSDSLTERQKAYAQRIDHQYFQRPHPWRTTMLVLSVALPVIGIVAAAIVHFMPAGERMYLPGPVSKKHQLFASRCDECHDMTAIGGPVLDTKCLNCHDGPMHHPKTIDPHGNILKQVVAGKTIDVSTPKCASCHIEHRGNANLATISNDTCMQCHADLRRSDGAKPEVQAKITRFDGDHPEWKVLRDKQLDDSPFHFSHRLHADPEQATWPAAVIKAARENPVIICQQCHQPDESARYFKPIAFNDHCAQCHGMQDKFSPAVAPIGKVTFTHGDPRIIASEVRSAVATYLFTHGGTPTLLAKAQGPKSAEDADDTQDHKQSSAPNDARTPEQWIQDYTAQILQPLYAPAKEKQAKSCLKCHIASSLDSDGLLQVSPKKFPNAFLSKSRFDHHAHRSLNCVSCHESVLNSQSVSKIMVPSMTSCLKCHSSSGGARTECVECHRFHERDLIHTAGQRSIGQLERGLLAVPHPPAPSDSEGLNQLDVDSDKESIAKLGSEWSNFVANQKAKLAERAAEQASKAPVVTTQANPPVAPVEPAKVQPLPSIPAKTITCPHCGMQWPLSAKYCGRCGIKLQHPAQ